MALVFVLHHRVVQVADQHEAAQPVERGGGRGVLRISPARCGKRVLRRVVPNPLVAALLKAIALGRQLAPQHGETRAAAEVRHPSRGAGSSVSTLLKLRGSVISWPMRDLQLCLCGNRVTLGAGVHSSVGLTGRCTRSELAPIPMQQLQQRRARGNGCSVRWLALATVLLVQCSLSKASTQAIIQSVTRCAMRSQRHARPVKVAHQPAETSHGAHVRVACGRMCCRARPRSL